MTKRWDEMDGGWIDSRDIIDRTEELNSAADEEPSDLGCTACGEESFPDDTFPSLGPECAAELTLLRAASDEGADTFEDWPYGTTLVPEHDWENYARQLADDIGAITGDEGWPQDYIDWVRAADALKMDYSSIDIDGTTYWGR